MITKHDDLLGTLIHDVAHLLRHEIDRRLKKYNLTRVKWLALGIISKRPDLTQRELAEEMELGNAAVGRLVDRLEERGFVERQTDPEDRRAHRLSQTASADRLLVELESLAIDLRADLLKGFDEKEVAGLNRGLTKLKDNIVAATLATVIMSTFAAQRFYAEIQVQLGAMA